MSWIGVGVAAVGAISGAESAKRNRKAQQRHDAFRKAAIQYSPWTGMSDPGAGNFGNQDTFTGMLGGAAQGYALGSGVGGGLTKAGVIGQGADTATQLSNAQGAMNVGMNTGQAVNLGAQNIAPGGMLASNMGSAGTMGGGGLYSQMQNMNNQLQSPFASKNFYGMMG